MVLLRRMIGDALRARRQAQHRTLREVSTAANVSLGYLSEIERGQKEASSELLSAVCDALGTPLSEVLHEVSHSVAREEGNLPAAAQEMAPVAEVRPAAQPSYATRQMRPVPESVEHPVAGDGVSVTVRRDSPLKTTLVARRHGTKREVVGAA